MEPPFIVEKIEKWTIIQFRLNSLMDPVVLEDLAHKLYPIIDEQDQRRIVLDFERVEFLSSQAIGIVLTIKKKLSTLPGGKLVLCGVGARLAELLKITRLDKMLIIKPTQREAVRTAL